MEWGPPRPHTGKRRYYRPSRSCSLGPPLSSVGLKGNKKSIVSNYVTFKLKCVVCNPYPRIVIMSFEENTLSNIAKLDHSIMHKSHIILHDITKSGQQGIPVPSKQGWEALLVPVPVIMIQTTFYPSCCGLFLWCCF